MGAFRVDVNVRLHQTSRKCDDIEIRVMEHYTELSSAGCNELFSQTDLEAESYTAIACEQFWRDTK